ncbi:MAG: VWA domain-containing protein [Defluviitaleaceae bacterium]|nr:VWA domain-containing protein [Defluviitaleaceae bacterium]
MRKVIIVLLLFVCFTKTHVSAERAPIDAVLVLDVSFSMRHTDPGRLAQEAMGLFIDALGTYSGDRVGVVAYAGEVVDYIPLTAIYGLEDADIIRGFINGLGHAGWTDHSLGLDKALHILIEGNNANPIPFIILLTDGNMEISPASLRTYADAYADLERVVAYAAYKNVLIHTVGLNHNGTLNRAYIDSIASATGGRSYETTTAEALNDIINDILAILLSPQPEQSYMIFIDDELRQPEAVTAISASYGDHSIPPAYHPTEPPDSAPHQTRLRATIILGGSAVSKLIFLLLFIRRRSRVFTGKIILESSDRKPRHHNLIAYGKRTTLRALHGGGAQLDKVILTPSPYTPSHKPQLLLTCKHPLFTFRKDYMETDAKKGLTLSPGMEVTILLPENDTDIRLRYVA